MIGLGKYIASINGKEIELLVISEDTILFNGKEIKFEYSFLKKDVISLRIEGKNYQVSLSDEDSQPEENSYSLDFYSKKYETICRNETDLLIDKFSSGKKDNLQKNNIKSPMPGIILKLNVKVNDAVKKGDILLVLEAMKMENELKSPRDGIIKKISISEKTSVEKNQLLIELE